MMMTMMMMMCSKDLHHRSNKRRQAQTWRLGIGSPQRICSTRLSCSRGGCGFTLPRATTRRRKKRQMQKNKGFSFGGWVHLLQLSFFRAPSMRYPLSFVAIAIPIPIPIPLFIVSRVWPTHANQRRPRILCQSPQVTSIALRRKTWPPDAAFHPSPTSLVAQ